MPFEYTVLVDRASLLSRGIGADSLVEIPKTTGPARQPNMLNHWDLQVVVQPGVVLLTTSDRLAHWSQQLRCLSGGEIPLYRAGSDWLKGALQDPEGVFALGQIISLDAWLAAGDSIPSDLVHGGDRSGDARLAGASRGFRRQPIAGR